MLMKKRIKKETYLSSDIGGKYRLAILNGESSESYKKKNMIQKEKTMDKYAQIKRFQHEFRLQVYMYDLI